MADAQLINRGEQFAVTDGSARFEGECAWSWAQVPGDLAEPVYPLRILVRSIHRTGLGRVLPLSVDERLRVARLAKQLLEAREPGSNVLLLEND